MIVESTPILFQGSASQVKCFTELSPSAGLCNRIILSISEHFSKEVGVSDSNENASKPNTGVVKSADSVALGKVAAGENSAMQILIGPLDGAPGFTLRRFVMGGDGGMPLHTNEVEHEQYVLAGKARITIGDQGYDVETGDAIFIPARVPHAYRVREAPFEFLCIVPNREDSIRVVQHER